MQLESRLTQQQLSLQNLKFYLQRSGRTMHGLQKLCFDIHGQKQSISIVRNDSLHLLNNKLSSLTTDPSSNASSLLKQTNHNNINNDEIHMGCKGGGLLNMVQKAIDMSGYVLFLFLLFIFIFFVGTQFMLMLFVFFYIKTIYTHTEKNKFVCFIRN